MGNSYISEEPKSVRERYILVEAIAIVIRAGLWNIYVAEAVGEIYDHPTRNDKGRTRFNGSDIFHQNQHPSLIARKA